MFHPDLKAGRRPAAALPRLDVYKRQELTKMLIEKLGLLDEHQTI